MRYSLGGMMAALLVCTPVVAATVVQSARTGADWDVQCDDAQHCTISRIAFNAESNENLVTFAIDVAGAAQSLTVTVPLGIAVSPGVRVLVGDTTAELPVLVCLPTGCVTARALSGQDVQGIMAVDKIDVQFFAFQNETLMSVEMDVTGLGRVIRNAVTWRDDLR